MLNTRSTQSNLKIWKQVICQQHPRLVLRGGKRILTQLHFRQNVKVLWQCWSVKWTLSNLTMFYDSKQQKKAIVHACPEIYKVQIPKDFYKSLNGLQHICQISVSKQSGHSGITNDMCYRTRSQKYSLSMIDIVINKALTYIHTTFWANQENKLVVCKLLQPNNCATLGDHLCPE